MPDVASIQFHGIAHRRREGFDVWKIEGATHAMSVRIEGEFRKKRAWGCWPQVDAGNATVQEWASKAEALKPELAS
jgi:hypothetical protein